jgi:uncharacterized membrane protein
MKILYGFCLILYISGILIGCSRQPVMYQEAPVKDNRIIIPLSRVSDGQVHFFTYKNAGKRINFFIRTDGKGTISSYFDACYTCYKAKKGYRQEGSDVVCNECSMKFGLAEEKWHDKGGCNPIVLKSSLENNTLIIDKAVIEKGAKLF